MFQFFEVKFRFANFFFSNLVILKIPELFTELMKNVESLLVTEREGGGVRDLKITS